LKRTVLALGMLPTLLFATEARAQDISVLYIEGVALLAVLPGFLFDVPQPDAEQAYLKVSGGLFDVIDHENEATDFLIEYQPGHTWHRIKPIFGMAANSDGSFYSWVAAGHDFHVTSHFLVHVNTGPALYLDGESGKELGSVGVLRSGFGIGIRFGGRARLTASYHHMSHGELLDHWNPGTEVVAFNLAWGLH
jgi:hypothetical protein